MPVKGKIIPLRDKYERAVIRKPGCWGWRLAKVKGYGALSHNGNSLRAHRVAYELFVGAIPDGACVMHRCDNPECSNPAHLMLGTQADNQADKVRKGRQAKGANCGATPDRRARGERHGRSKLNDEQVKQLHLLAAQGMKHAAIGAKLGISRSGVGKILSGKYRILVEV